MKNETLRDIALFFLGMIAMMLAYGCATKTRNVELDGMYVTDTGTLAIGSVDVMSSPKGEESAVVRYAEDTAWLSPTTKTHEIKIMLTGTNAVGSATSIVESICRTFTTDAATNGKVKITSEVVK